MPVTLTYEPPIGAESVAVAGSFNGWSPTATPMRERAGRFARTLDLPPGRHLYKFVVNGELWLPDPGVAARSPDGHGGENTVLVVTRPGPPARRGDGRLDAPRIRHDPAMPLHRRRLPTGGLAVALEVRADDVEAVRAVGPSGAGVDLEPAPLVGDRELFSGVLPAGTGSYRFVLRDGPNRDGFGAGGWTPLADAALPLPAAGAPRLAPAPWVQDAVFYQVFPDRFANGDPGNDPPGTLPFGAPPTLWDPQGGDLAGLRARLPWIRDRGFTALYLNPVFEAPSNHKYDTRDYRRVDPSFGTTGDLRALVSEAHALGMRVILDGVFNHTGDEHFAFEDLKARGRRSPYRSWYTVHDWPPRVLPDGEPTYAAWWGFPHLPELRTEEPAVRDHVRGVVRHWHRVAGIDGWRLDVPNEVPHEFWERFRAWVRAEDPDAYLVGEIWEDGHPWMQGDEFDGVMNYRLRGLLLDHLVRERLDGPAFLEAVAALEASHPPELYRCMLNLLGSHDTPRIRTLAGDDRATVRAALAFVFTSPGAPMVYYGDEVGLPGGEDPDCRRAYPWGAEPWPGLAVTVRALARLRAEQPDLRRGRLEPLPGPPGWLLYGRGALTCVLRTGGAKALPPGHLPADAAQIHGPVGAYRPDGSVRGLPPGGLLVLDPDPAVAPRGTRVDTRRGLLDP